MPNRRIVLLCFLAAFLAARLSGAHLHLCFDGKEPPAAVHLTDSAYGDHHSHDTSDHDDRDIDLVGSAYAKLVKLDSAFAAFVAVCAILLLAPSRILPGHRFRPDPPPAPRRYLRPLLRAPPT